MDVGPMEPCPVNKKGRHEIGVVVPGDDDHDLTFFCADCGSLRRVTASGGFPLDDLTATEIKRITMRSNNAER